MVLSVPWGETPDSRPFPPIVDLQWEVRYDLLTTTATVPKAGSPPDGGGLYPKVHREMDRSWLDDDDGVIRGLLSGAKGDFREGIASETVQQWLQQIGYSKRRRLENASILSSLANAVAESLFRTIASIASEPEARALWILILDRWLKQGTVMSELSGLLSPGSGQLDLMRLEKELHVVASNRCAEPISENSAKPQAVDFVQEFHRCITREPILSKVIDQDALGEMVRLSTKSMADVGTTPLEFAAGRPDLTELLDSPGIDQPAEPEPASEKRVSTADQGENLRRGSQWRPVTVVTESVAQPSGSPEEAGETPSPSGPALFASHWVEDNQLRVFDMDAIRLQTGIDYWYGFRVSREVRAGASMDSFSEPAALKEREETVVFVEITSALLGSDRFERRRTVYVRGVGIPDQYFRLRAETSGRTPLRVQIVHDNIPVYSRHWTLSVTEGLVPAPPRDGPTAAAGRPSSQSLGPVAGFGPVQRDVFRLKCDKQRLEVLSPDMQSWPGNPKGLMVDPKIKMSVARKKLHTFAQEKGMEKSFTKDTVRAFLREMATWGRDCYDLIFDDTNEALRTRVIEKLPLNSLLTIDTDSPSFPWEWLYLGEVPGPDDDFLEGDARSKFLDGFWGIRFGISILPTTSGNRIGILPALSNSAQTRVLSSINPTAYPETAKANLELIKQLPKSFPLVSTEIAQGRRETIEMLRAATSPHFVYFYCHHRAGENFNEFGYLDDAESVLFLRGEDEEPLSVSELKHDVRLSPFPVPETPLVFLNACGSSQGQDFHPSGFVPYFTHSLLAATVIGTLAEIPAGQGLKMATDFLTLWFRGMSAATVLQFLRRQWLEEQLNPFAMYYTLNGIANLSLKQRLQP